MSHEMSEELQRTLNDVITDFSLLADANQFLASFHDNNLTDHQREGLAALHHCLGCYGVLLVEQKHDLIFGS